MDSSAPPPTVEDILSQAEVEALLAQVANEQGTVEFHQPNKGPRQLNRDAIQPYDFRHPAFLSATELRKIRLGHDDYVRALAARMSIYLRMDFSLEISKLTTLPFRKFTESLATPTCITIFKAEPLRGICILELNPGLALTMLDRLLGGPGLNADAEHTPTDIELSLIDQAVTLILAEWCKHWNPIELKPLILGHEDNGNFLQTSSDETMMLVITMEARLGDCKAPIQMAFPYFTIEPIIAKICASFENNTQPSNPSPAPPPKWNHEFDDVLVPVTAQWESIEITARELSQLKLGDFIQLRPDCVEEIQVRLAAKPKFIGRLGTQGNHWAVELKQHVSS